MNKKNYKALDSFMDEAIDEARLGIGNEEGGPFGCVIVKDGKIVGRGHNRVLLKKDSTCHGEMEAIRDAEKNLDTHSLKGCILYTTGEPCPMCMGAILWADIDKVYYGCTLEDNGIIGFRDKKFEEFSKGREKLGSFLEERDRKSCLMLFDEYLSMHHTIY